MAKFENIETAILIILERDALESVSKTGIITLSESGDLVEVKDKEKALSLLKQKTAEIIKEYWEALSFFMEPETISILAKSLTPTNLEEVGIESEIIELLKKADTQEAKEEVVDLLPPASIFPLFKLKTSEIRKYVLKLESEKRKKIIKLCEAKHEDTIDYLHYSLFKEATKPIESQLHFRPSTNPNK